jgi:hypothetical protein
LDTLAATTLVDQKFSMADVLTAALNATEYYIGFFGLGITQGNFAGVVHESPLTQAVQAYGRIPSYSYGYTAGAYYSEKPFLHMRRSCFRAMCPASPHPS